MWNLILISMKKLVLLISVLILGVSFFSSCEDQGATGYYYYSVEFKISQNSDVSSIDNALEPRINKLFTLTSEQAQDEWNSFLDSVDESAVVIKGEDYYTVTFSKMKEQGMEFVPDKTVGTKTWKVE